MSQRVKRVLNAFVIGFLATGGSLIIEDEKGIEDAVSVGDWTSLKFLVVPLIGGAIAGGIRYVQAKFAPVPSPEPEENGAPVA